MIYIQSRKFLLFFVFILITSAVNAINIKMENSIQYNNAKIILEEKVFPESSEKVEVEVTLGGSSGRMLINRKEIFMLELPHSIIKPRIIKKTGTVKITDFADKPVEYGFISPFDLIEISEKSQMELSFNSIPALRIGANTVLRADIKEVESSFFHIDESQSPSAIADDDAAKSEEFVFFLKHGELFGIFDEKINEYTSGFVIDCEDAFMIIKSPRFYIKYSVTNGETQLTIFPLAGHIIFTAKKMNKKFLLRAGKYIDMYNGDRLQKPLDYNQSPEMMKLFNSLDKK